MELTSQDRKVLTLGLLSLRKILKHQPQIEKEIEQAAEKVGVLREYKMVQKMYETFDSFMGSAKKLEEPKPEDQATVDLIKKAMESTDNPDLN